MKSDVIVIGGGMVGAAIGYGLASAGARVRVLDEGDTAFRAARGNFGLTWVQSKGLDSHSYFLLSLESVNAWGAFAAELRDRTGVDVAFHRDGGLILCLNETEALARRDFIARANLRAGADGYDCRFIDRGEVQALFPAAQLGPAVTGASFSPMDGHANPLFLLRAMVTGLSRAGGQYHPGQSVEDITRIGSGYAVRTSSGTFQAERLVIAAGLGTTRLAAMVGIKAPVQPQRGQLIATERTGELFRYPMSGLRQTDEGTVLIGLTQEDVGFNIDTTTAGMQHIAQRAIASFPILGNLRFVRAWAALRVLTPDQKPIYAESQTHPGAFVATCHSGVTLAAAHARLFPDWVLEGRFPDQFASFSPERFHVQTAA